MTSLRVTIVLETNPIKGLQWGLNYQTNSIDGLSKVFLFLKDSDLLWLLLRGVDSGSVVSASALSFNLNEQPLNGL